MSRRVSILGEPSSLGAYAPGQENAPRALREAGLVERLRESGLEVVDHGDAEMARWRPDRAGSPARWPMATSHSCWAATAPSASGR